VSDAWAQLADAALGRAARARWALRWTRRWPRPLRAWISAPRRSSRPS
jgi:hypothetical protein